MLNIWHSFLRYTKSNQCVRLVLYDSKTSYILTLLVYTNVVQFLGLLCVILDKYSPLIMYDYVDIIMFSWHNNS